MEDVVRGYPAVLGWDLDQDGLEAGGIIRIVSVYANVGRVRDE